MSRRSVQRAAWCGLLALAVASLVRAPALTAEPADPLAAVIEVGDAGLTVATALAKLADEAGLKLVVAVPAEMADRRLEVPAGRQAARDVVAAVKAVLGVDAHTTGQTTALGQPLRLKLRIEVKTTALASGGAERCVFELVRAEGS